MESHSETYRCVAGTALAALLPDMLSASMTSLTASTDPVVDLLVRSTTGTWSSYPVAIVQQNPTRPVLLIDGNHRQLYVFFTKNPAHPQGIFYKQSAVDSIMKVRDQNT